MDGGVRIGVVYSSHLETIDIRIEEPAAHPRAYSSQRPDMFEFADAPEPDLRRFDMPRERWTLNKWFGHKILSALRWAAGCVYALMGDVVVTDDEGEFVLASECSTTVLREKLSAIYQKGSFRKSYQLSVLEYLYAERVGAKVLRNLQDMQMGALHASQLDMQRLPGLTLATALRTHEVGIKALSVLLAAAAAAALLGYVAIRVDGINACTAWARKTGLIAPTVQDSAIIGFGLGDVTCLVEHGTNPTRRHTSISCHNAICITEENNK